MRPKTQAKSATKSKLDLGPKLGLIAKVQRKTHKEIAAHAGTSLTTVQRILSGRTDPRASEFIPVLKELDIDLRGHIEDRLSESLSGAKSSNKMRSRGISQLIAKSIQGLDRLDQISLLTLLVTILRHSKEETQRTAADGIDAHLLSLRGA